MRGDANSEHANVVLLGSIRGSPGSLTGFRPSAPLPPTTRPHPGSDRGWRPAPEGDPGLSFVAACIP
jgi:hypothetical protein